MHKGRIYHQVPPQIWFKNFARSAAPGFDYFITGLLTLQSGPEAIPVGTHLSVLDINRKQGTITWSGGFSLGLEPFGIQMAFLLHQDRPEHEIGFLIIDNHGGSMLYRFDVPVFGFDVSHRGQTWLPPQPPEIATFPFVSLDQFTIQAIDYSMAP